MARFFGRRQRNQLYLQAGGKCRECGADLEAGWHADHKRPYSKGGQTELSNGQALCPVCNTRKGGKLDTTQDRIRLRKFQESIYQMGMARFARGERVLLVDAHAGSGKTLGMLHLGNALFRERMIDAVIAFVPRLNLCRQFENDWNEVAPLYGVPRMGRIEWRTNEPPLIRSKEQFGYVTTYASLVSELGLHFAEVKNKRVLLLLDEAQILGADEEEEEATGAAQAIGILAPYASYIVVASGTPYRSDGKPLLFGRYSEPDTVGRRFLLADVRATYQQGVSQGYLRPFEAHIFDGEGKWEWYDGEVEHLTLSQMESGLFRILTKQKFWKDLVDAGVQKVRHLQKTVDPRMAGLIAARSQGHAKQIKEYIERSHKDIRALIAVSEDKQAAHNNLDDFRKGGYDILITVRMAYVGYDYKPISVIVALTDYRKEGFLRQLFARGMRMMPDVPMEHQVLWLIVPGDPLMIYHIKQMQTESEAGLVEREKRLGGAGVEPGPTRQGQTVDAYVTDRSAIGLNESGDLNPDELSVLERALRGYRMDNTPRTEIAAFLRGVGVSIRDIGDRIAAFGEAREAPRPADTRTTREKELDLRSALHKECRKADGRLMEIGLLTERDWGHTAKQYKAAFNDKRPPESLNLEELRARLEWVTNDWEAYVRDAEERYRPGSTAYGY